ncbi:hypothetical protein [Methylocapsa palsarum]|uniref:hypothetical protein n=1 Tax=Methylocapsa palsarum TaxID=1612308 RepID=UPI000B867B39|nr:hypothetical protein [Methylocapsa palsarum]
MLDESRSRSALAAAAVIAGSCAPSVVAAQDAESDVEDARLDAVVATPGASSPQANSDNIGGSLRLQYVDLNNDQSFRRNMETIGR